MNFQKLLVHIFEDEKNYVDKDNNSNNSNIVFRPSRPYLLVEQDTFTAEWFNVGQ